MQAPKPARRDPVHPCTIRRTSNNNTCTACLLNLSSRHIRLSEGALSTVKPACDAWGVYAKYEKQARTRSDAPLHLSCPRKSHMHKFLYQSQLAHCRHDSSASACRIRWISCAWIRCEGRRATTAHKSKELVIIATYVGMLFCFVDSCGLKSDGREKRRFAGPADFSCGTVLAGDCCPLTGPVNVNLPSSYVRFLYRISPSFTHANE